VKLLLLIALAAGGREMSAIEPGSLEGRPPAAEASPLQARVDAAAPGARIDVGPGEYPGDLVLERPVTLVGRGRPRLLGSGKGSVVRVRAPGVTLEGFDIDGRGGGSIDRDSSGIHVAAADFVARDCRITGALFGVYLRAADGARVEHCEIHGIPGRDDGEKGSGIHIWNTRGFELTGNVIDRSRDGLYIQSSSGGKMRGNVVRNVRYGLHFMYSDDNTFEENVFADSAAGGVLMYSRRLTLRRNQFLHNRGFASVGVLCQSCEDSVAEDNVLLDNARGLFLEGSRRNVFRRNLIADSDAAIILFDSCAANRFEDNAFVGNLSPLTLVGRRTDTSFDGNYWSDNDRPDLDGDGRSDGEYVLSSLFDHLRGNLLAADLMVRSPAAVALAAAERAFPVLEAVKAVDHRPLSRLPDLSRLPVVHTRARSRSVAGMATGLGLIAFGAAVLSRGRRR
jgi:nitrous oxidase accessory protein